VPLSANAGAVLPLTGPATDTATAPQPNAVGGSQTGQQAQAAASAPQEAAGVASDGLDSTLVLIAIAVLAIPLLVVMALVATVLTRR